MGDPLSWMSLPVEDAPRRRGRWQSGVGTLTYYLKLSSGGAGRGICVRGGAGVQVVEVVVGMDPRLGRSRRMPRSVGSAQPAAQKEHDYARSCT